ALEAANERLAADPTAAEALARGQARLAELQESLQNDAFVASLHQCNLAVPQQAAASYEQSRDVSPRAGLNDFLSALWNGDQVPQDLFALAPEGITPESLAADLELTMSNVGLILSRMPHDNEGSFVLVLPQVSSELTRKGINRTVEFSRALA